MLKLKPQYIFNKKGKKIGIILNIKEFSTIMDELEDYYEYETIKNRINKKEKTYTQEEVMAELLGKK